MPNDRRRAATAHEVAKLAGVSQSAVSRAFTPGASVSEKTRAKIKLAADELGYRPNMLARSLIKRKSKIVGVISGYMEHPLFARSIERLANGLAKSDLRILLFTSEHGASADKLVDEMLSYQVTALILIGVSVSSVLADECARVGLPVILFSRTAAATGAAIEVLGDNEYGAQVIAQRFLDRGRERIAFMAGYSDSPTSIAREAAFMGFFAERGLPAPRRVVGNYKYEDAAAATRELFADESDRPDALFCANDIMAIAAVDTIRLEYGLTAGEECLVAGLDNVPMAAWPSVGLTTYSQPMDEMCDEAIHIINDPAYARTISQVVKKGSLHLRRTA